MKKTYQTVQIMVSVIGSSDVIRTSDLKDPWENEPSEWGKSQVADLNAKL